MTRPPSKDNTEALQAVSMRNSLAGFSVVELLFAGAIIAVGGGVATLFFGRVMNASHGMQLSANAQVAADMNITRLQQDFKRLGGQFTIPTGTFSYISFGSSSDFVTFQNRCVTIPSFVENSAGALPRDLSGVSGFEDCPQKCLPGERPVIQVTRTGRITPEFIPALNDRQAIAGMLCASAPTNTKNSAIVTLLIGYQASQGSKKKGFWEVKSTFLSDSFLLQNRDRAK